MYFKPFFGSDFVVDDVVVIVVIVVEDVAAVVHFDDDGIDVDDFIFTNSISVPAGRGTANLMLGEWSTL